MLAALLGAIIGTVLALTGAGGGILAVPMLVSCDLSDLMASSCSRMPASAPATTAASSSTSRWSSAARARMRARRTAASSTAGSGSADAGSQVDLSKSTMA